LCLLYNNTIIEDVSLSTSTPIGEENDTWTGMSFTGVDWNDDTLAGIGDDDRVEQSSVHSDGKLLEVSIFVCKIPLGCSGDDSNWSDSFVVEFDMVFGVDV
jgi:hypothetical protein